MKNLQRFGLLLLAVVLVFSLAACGDKKGSIADDAVIAEFDGGKVTKKEFDTYMGIAYFFDPALKAYLNSVDEDQQMAVFDAYLGAYIGERYLANQLNDSKDLEKKAEGTLKIFKDNLTEQLGGSKKYTDALKAEKLTNDDLLDYMLRYYKAEEYLVSKAYNETPEMFTIATVAHILIGKDERSDAEAKSLAQDLLNQLKAGADFTELAKEYTDDGGSLGTGGVYEDVPVALWVPEFMEAAVSLPIGELSELVKTDYGYHIIKVLERELPELEDVSDEGRNIVFSSAYTDFITDELEKILR